MDLALNKAININKHRLDMHYALNSNTNNHVRKINKISISFRFTFKRFFFIKIVWVVKGDIVGTT